MRPRGCRIWGHDSAATRRGCVSARGRRDHACRGSEWRGDRACAQSCGGDVSGYPFSPAMSAPPSLDCSSCWHGPRCQRAAGIALLGHESAGSRSTGPLTRSGRIRACVAVWRQDHDAGPWWPYWVTCAELRHRLWSRPGPLRPSWCPVDSDWRLDRIRIPDAPMGNRPPQTFARSPSSIPSGEPRHVGRRRRPWSARGRWPPVWRCWL